MDRTLLTFALLPLLAACGPKEGTLRVSIYGEEYIEEGIPAEDLNDGWSVRFDKFLISVGDVTAATSGGSPALRDPAYRVFDLSRPSQGAGFPVTMGAVPGGAYDQVGYRVAPPGAGAQAGNASAADVQLLVQRGLSLYIEGSAEKGGARKTWKWGFPTATTYGKCHSTAQVDGAAAQSQLTIHGDHLFYDDLFSEEPNVSFDLVASADKDNNGEVTQAELTALDISKEARYQVGSTGIKDLGAFIAYQTSTLGHIDGEGHCDVTERK